MDRDSQPPDREHSGDDQRIRVGERADGRAVWLPVERVLTGRGFATGKSGSGKSVLEGTPVYTADGRKPIEDVEEGERVLSLNKRTFEQEFREVVGTLSHTAENLIRITLEDGTELVGTKDHSFLTVEDLEIVPIRGDDLEEGTWIPLSRSLPSVERVRQIDLGDYVEESNNISIEQTTIRSSSKHDDRYVELDFEAGKVLGLYLAEGSFDSKQTLQISTTDDRIKEFLGANGFKVYDRTCNRAFRPFAEFLEAEFGRGSGDKHIPNWVHNAPQDFIAGLLSGYFDGDGTINDTNVTAISKSPRLLSGLAELLRQFGISTTIEDKLVLYGDETLDYKRIRIDAFVVGRFNDVVDLTIEEKQNKLDRVAEQLQEGDAYNSKDLIPNFGEVLNIAARENEWTKRESENRTKAASAHHLTRKQKAGRKTYNHFVEELGIEGRAKQFGRSDVQWKRVVAIEELEEERTVYDLDVELNDNFVANGAFVHNSNTASVVIEELLDAGYPVMVVDTDGEYWGLKETFEVLHVGADEECDLQVGPEHAERLATLALEENVPIVLDVSGFLDEDAADELLRETARHLFAKEKKLKKPFLLVVEEVHEYIPETAGLGETGKMLIKVGKRGRKHGLGILGISQRPADVKKDFITQANWLVWHRLTWENDTKVVRRIVGSEYGDAVSGLDAGEAFVQLDWTDADVRRVRFDRKRTFDAGATPGLEEFERPELESVDDALVEDLAAITERQREERDRVESLEAELDRRDDRIESLEAELDRARDVSTAAEQIAEALVPGSVQTRLQSGTDRVAALEDRFEALEDRVDDLASDAPGSDASGTATELPGDESALPTADERSSPSEDSGGTAPIDAGTPDGAERPRLEGFGDWPDTATPPEDRDPAEPPTRDPAHGGRGENAPFGEPGAGPDRVADGDDPTERADPDEGPATDDRPASDDERPAVDRDRLSALLETDAVATRLLGAVRESDCNRRHASRTVAALAADGPLGIEALDDRVDAPREHLQTLLAALRTRSLVTGDRHHVFELDVEGMERAVETADDRAHLGELRRQWEVDGTGDRV